MPSLLQGDTEEVCYICGLPNVDFHHLLNKTEKNFAESIGAWVYLCRGHHRYIHDTSEGQKLWKRWKAQAQEEFEKTHTREEWMKGCHRNYLTW